MQICFQWEIISLKGLFRVNRKTLEILKNRTGLKNRIAFAKCPFCLSLCFQIFFIYFYFYFGLFWFIYFLINGGLEQRCQSLHVLAKQLALSLSAFVVYLSSALIYIFFLHTKYIRMKRGNHGQEMGGGNEQVNQMKFKWLSDRVSTERKQGQGPVFKWINDQVDL